MICVECGYAYYGKAISTGAAKGADAGTTRLPVLRGRMPIASAGGASARTRRCGRTSSTPRSGRRSESCWNSRRLTAEYQRRLDQPLPAASELTTVETQVHKLRQGLARLIDSYAEGLIDKGEFEPRITRLRQRMGHFEEQAPAR